MYCCPEFGHHVSVTNKSNVEIKITAIYLYKHELMLVEVKLPATLITKLQVVESRFPRIAVCFTVYITCTVC